VHQPLARHEGDVRRPHGVGVTLDLEARILSEHVAQVVPFDEGAHSQGEPCGAGAWPVPGGSRTISTPRTSSAVLPGSRKWSRSSAVCMAAGGMAET